LLRLQAAKLQLKALRAQMNPHFLFNALNSIQNYITSNEVTNAAKYLARFAKLMRQSLEYSDLEVVSLEKEIAFLSDYLYINEKLRFEDRLSYKIIVDDEIEEDITGVPTMIVQPYVENAIEHGLRNKESGNIRVDFSLYNEDTILCVVEDDGIGRDKARQMHLNDGRYKNHRSRGTAITEQRLQLLYNSREKKVYVHTIDLRDEETGEALGTRVEIKIPIIDVHTR
jgi:LytS/YehU family sensor histidine kinase